MPFHSLPPRSGGSSGTEAQEQARSGDGLRRRLQARVRCCLRTGVSSRGRCRLGGLSDWLSLTIDQATFPHAYMFGVSRQSRGLQAADRLRGAARVVQTMEGASSRSLAGLGVTLTACLRHAAT